MQRSWGRQLLWLMALVAVVPQGSLGNCTIADLAVFAYSEPEIDLLPASVPDSYLIKYRCKLGFARIPGRNETTTCINNAWSPMQELCAVVKCEDPIVKHGTKLSGFRQSYTYGDNVTFECKIGYFMIGSYFIRCENNTWYPAVPSCKKLVPDVCGAPVIPSGIVDPLQLQYSKGSIVTLQCKPNYAFPDETIEMSVICEGYNLWDPPVQPCFIRTSRDTSEFFIYNGKIVRGKKTLYEPGDEVTVECLPGYALNGPSKVRYVGGGKWLPEHPSCYLNGFFILLITALVLIVALLAVKMIYDKYRSL